MTVKLKTPSNGSVSLTPQDTASDVVLTVPAGTSTVVTNATLPTQLNASGSAPIYACRAWVNFNGAPKTGTYSQSGTLITITITSHGVTNGESVNISFTSGAATGGSFIATVVDANTFTVTSGSSLTTSGNVTMNLYIRRSGNVSSITDNGTGDYTVNFTTAMPDADYVVSCSWAEDNLNTVTGGTPGGRFVNNYATGSVRVHPVQNLGNSTFSDVLICTVAIFR